MDGLKGNGHARWRWRRRFPDVVRCRSHNGNGPPLAPSWGRCPALRLVHSTGVARIALLIGKAADQIGGGKLPKENAARSLSSGEHAQSEETRAAGEPRASLRTIRRKCSAAPICCRAKSADGWLPRLDRRADLPAATGSLTGLVDEGHEVLLTILSGGSLSIYVAWRPTTEIKPANRSACTNPAWDRESEYLPAETNARSRTGPRS